MQFRWECRLELNLRMLTAADILSLKEIIALIHLQRFFSMYNYTNKETSLCQDDYCNFISHIII